MGLKHEDLELVRELMVDEIDLDEKSDRINRSAYLTQAGQGRWPDLLRKAAKAGNDDTLTIDIKRQNLLTDRIQKRKPEGGHIMAAVPVNGAEVLAEAEFNAYFCRGLSRYAQQNDIPRLEVYRAKAVREPRQGSQEKIGLLVDPKVILIDLRASVGVEPALGIPPGPGSGITLRIPKK